MRYHVGKSNPNYKHGLTKTHLFQTWSNAKSRCSDPNSLPFKDYGGRGITVCEEWKNDFKAFYDWAMANGYKEGLTLDRIDNNQGYSPDNCRWATVKEQSNNRRSNTFLVFCGERKTISQWADDTGISRETLYKRLANGWDIEETLTTPTRKYTKK
jgi:hypothetical protein